MYRVALFVVVVVLVFALTVSLSSCTKPIEVVEDSPPPEMPVEDVSQPTEEAAAPTSDMDIDSIVEKVGAPIFEGATGESAMAEDGANVAIFTSSASYKEVKEFYLGELKDPEWTNNGFEMGAMGGDDWEFKSADGTKLVAIKRDSDASVTTIKLTIKPAE